MTTKSKLESQIASMENEAQISGKYTLHIIFSKKGGKPLTSVHRLKDHLPQLTWKDLKSEPLR